MQYPIDTIPTIHQMHQNGGTNGNTNGTLSNAQQQQHQQMMYHARSYESGIGMYRNYLLEPFPNRYRNYLQQNWHDENNNNNINKNKQIYGMTTLDDDINSTTKILYSDNLHQQKYQQQQPQHRHNNHDNNNNITTTTIYSNNHNICNNNNNISNNNYQQLQNVAAAAPPNTNIIVTNNPVCVNLNNISDIYGFCSGRPSASISNNFNSNNNNFSNPIYQCCTNNNNNCSSIIVTHNNRCGSESDLLYMTKIANPYNNHTNLLQNYSAIQTIDRKQHQKLQKQQLRRQNTRSLYDDTALVNLMQRNSSFDDNFLYPTNNHNYYHKFDNLNDQKNQKTLKPQFSNKKSNINAAAAGYQLKRSTSTESFFAIPFDGGDIVVEQQQQAIVKTGRFRKNSDKLAADKKKNKQLKSSSSSNKKQQLVRSSSQRNPVINGPMVHTKIIYAKDDHELMKRQRRRTATGGTADMDDDMESIYGFLKPRKIRSHGIRAK